MIETIHHNSATCWCDTMRANGHLAMLSIYGPRNSVRSVWASLSGKRRNYIHVGERWVGLEESASYVTMQRPLKRGDNKQPNDLMHLVILHPAATNRISGMADTFIVVGEEPKKKFRSRFNRLCRVPLRQQWLDDMWDRGCAAEEPLIKPLDGFGMPAYSVDCATEPWHEIVKEMIL
jgi:hypothetical protein